MTTLFHSLRALFVVALAAATVLHSQSSATMPALGLSRLESNAMPNSASPLASNKFSEDSLTAQGAGVKAAEKQGVKTLALDPSRDWSQPLRGNPNDPVFVSLLVYGSPETVIEVGGVILGILESDIAGFASLEARDASGKWQSLGLSVPLSRYDGLPASGGAAGTLGKPLAALPVLTIRLDPQAKVYDVFIGTTHLADNLPYDPNKGGRKVSVFAGEDGAMIMGLVQADENPLYEDANANGVDDRFEQQKNSRLLASTASVEERKTLAKDWREHQIRNPAASPALFLKVPLPDRE